MLPNHQADGIAKILEKPYSNPFGLGKDNDSLAWITCKPISQSNETQLRSCVSTDFMLKGEPFVVYEELTIPKEQQPEEKGGHNCHIFISKDITKSVSICEKGLYNFPIKVCTDIAATTALTISGPAHFILNESINGCTKTYLQKAAGIEVCSHLFTVEEESTGEDPSTRLIIKIDDMPKFMNSKLWLNGHMRLGQATRIGTQVLFSHQNEHFRPRIQNKKIQAYLVQDLPGFIHEPKLQKEEPVEGGDVSQHINAFYETKLDKDLVKIELTGDSKVGVLAYDSMFFDFTQPFLVGLMNMTNKELDFIVFL